MVAGFTPAPWPVTRYSNYYGWSVSGGDRGCIAERWYKDAADVESIYDEGEMEANAALISSAPTMYAALVQAEDALAIKASLRAPEQARVQAALEAVRAALSAARPAPTTTQEDGS